MDELTRCFEAHRSRLRSLAYRMLGSRAEADDAVQEAWLRLHRSDAGAIDNMAGWLTTVVSRVCLDALRARKFQGELPPEHEEGVHEAQAAAVPGPEHEAELADNVGAALMVVLQSVPPLERVAFVLHDTFDLSFDEIAPIVDRTPTAARQLASRARRRVQAAARVPPQDAARPREIVAAFLAAARTGDLAALLAVLAPDVVLRADAAAVAAAAASPGAPALAPRVEGAAVVAQAFKGRAQAARLALIDGLLGAVFAPGGTPRVAFQIAIEGGRIVEIGLVAEPARLGSLQVQLLER